jgi:hypothetical protein
MSKPKTFRLWTLEQTLLLPPSAVDWLAENHWLRTIWCSSGWIWRLNWIWMSSMRSYEQRDARGVKA